MIRKIIPLLALIGLLPVAELPAAITATFNGSGRLSISTTDGESCVISLDGDFVKVNGIDPDSGALLPDDLETLTFSGDNDSNLIDLSVITTASFPNFTRATVTASGGDDTLLCSGSSNTIDMGAGSDTVSNFGSGSALYDWSSGDGTESIVNDGSGTVRLRFGGSTRDDHIALSSPAENILQLTDNLTSDSISFENLTDLALQMNDGDDIVEAGDLSTVNWGTEIPCNKSGGSLIYNGPDSNQGVNFFLSGASTQINVTPGTGCDFNQNPLFAPSPFNFLVTKTGEDVRVSYEINSAEVVHLLRGLSTISLLGTPNDDSCVVENVGSESLDSLLFDGQDGSDSMTAVFQTSTILMFRESSIRTGDDTLTVDAEGKLVVQTSDTLETDEGFGDIEFRSIENIVLLNALAPLVDVMLVD